MIMLTIRDNIDRKEKDLLRMSLKNVDVHYVVRE